jgi:hypothetical protein
MVPDAPVIRPSNGAELSTTIVDLEHLRLLAAMGDEPMPEIDAQSWEAFAQAYEAEGFMLQRMSP